MARSHQARGTRNGAEFLRNHWYVAAWAEEVGRTPLARIVLGDYLVLFRTEGGKAVALENRCPHRNLPLSEGRLVGDTLECGYHGMVFDCSGACTHLPGEASPPHWARVRAYPVIERRWVERYERALRATGIAAISTYELCVANERREGGLVGSGMFVVNPPWQLDEELDEALPWLAERLAVDAGASQRAVR